VVVADDLDTFVARRKVNVGHYSHRGVVSTIQAKLLAEAAETE
jgi:hypothetical protein